MSVTISVTDTVCQSIDRTFFPPRVTVTGRSTTRVATIKGYVEFPGFESTPPKKYKSITWGGFSQQTAKAYLTELQCCGARYEWDGTGSINDQGQQISNYRRNYLAQCPSKNPNWPECRLIGGIVTNFDCKLDGYCWPPDPGSFPSCDTPFPLVGNAASNNYFTDQSGFPDIPDLPVDSKLHPVSSTYAASSFPSYFYFGFFLPGQVSNFPLVNLSGALEPWFQLDRTNDYFATLSDEYTDAIALANAVVTQGSGLVAQSRPRTRGFVSTWTTVDYTLHFSNILDGEHYVAIVYIGADDGSVTTIPYSFVGTGPTHQITAAAPVPPAGHSLVIRGATVIYAT